MSDVTAAPPVPLRPPLRPIIGPGGAICLERDDALRVALALNHLAALAHWSLGAGSGDTAIAIDAAWMAETLGDAVISD